MTIDDRTCHIYSEGEGGIAFLLGTERGDGEYVHRVFDLCCERTAKPFTLLAYECGDWNRDYSPWEADVGGPVPPFTGGGAATLAWLESACLASLRARGIRRFYTAGYSLSGLFALYALYESDLFCGAVACSSSLWFPGFLEYAKARQLHPGTSVYLSLGGKEEKSAPEYIKSVGDNTRALSRLLKQDANVSRTVLEMNPGGHFAPSEPRLAKGICWILENVVGE